MRTESYIMHSDYYFVCSVSYFVCSMYCPVRSDYHFMRSVSYFQCPDIISERRSDYHSGCKDNYCVRSDYYSMHTDLYPMRSESYLMHTDYYWIIISWALVSHSCARIIIPITRAQRLVFFLPLQIISSADVI